MHALATAVFSLVFVCASFVPACNAEPGIEASVLRFQSFFATHPRGHVVYTLVGTGFFRSMRTDTADKLVDAWVAAHPHAHVVSVSELPTGTRNVQLVHAWLVDGDDNLNLELVKRGAVPGSTMADPAQQFDALPEDSPLRKAGGGRHGRLVPDAEYLAFVKKVVAAEIEAKQNKSGIWADRYTETRELERVK